ncbi:tripartite tricarboxylate transporter substrate binding protein [Marinisporobacter balticus]|uniref:Putative tricarboxylic transport membrane protein n=1 Tax=Marinisporobacter balticus TaxID=2018667 RepID=A0A4R2L290_9FIRM|nr:tripartite tricarboxylate transporter substrate-binding protein [Marinisporobacter balticus]TCO79327.1 putative tricarboxylic transport membrane protein [Marinisporobacter balticus]
MAIKKKIIALGLAVSLVGAGLLTGCGSKDTQTAKEEPTEKYPKKAMEFIAPGGAGGGWDLTIRTTAKILKDTNLVSVPMPITNKSGGGGGINLAYMQTKKGSDSLISVYSPPLLLINLNGSTELSYKDTTPLARLITDYGVFVVPKDSKYTSISEVMEALKTDPKSVKIGGNSSAGSMDHIQFLMVAKAAGVENIKDIDYISFQDGTATAQILGGHVDLLSTGLGDVEQLLASGELKALAQTADKHVGQGVLAEIPTVKEQGIDVTFENWRGLFAAPEMPDHAVKYWRETLAKMVETKEWDEACKKNGWDKAYLDQEEFENFLGTANDQYKGILEEIGMAKK